MNKLSIITVNLNNGTGLEKTIQSVFSQSFKDLELIIIDGGSTDDSLEVIKKNEYGLTKWVSEKDDGIYYAMNKGINKATGEYLLFLNSGDTLVSQEILNEIFKYNYDHDILYGDVILHCPDNKKFERKYPDKLSMFFLFHSAICHQATLIKKALFKTVGFYNEEYKLASDWLFIIKAVIFENCTYKHVNSFISNYYVNGLSTLGNNKLSEERDSILKTLFPESILADYYAWYSLSKKKQLRKRVLNFIKRYLRKI